MAEDILGLTAQIVSAHVQRNPVDVDALAALIREVHATLAELGGGAGPAASVATSSPAEAEHVHAPAAPATLQPAVPITKSVFNDHIVCLEDGKKMTMLKRHLMTEHNMTVDQYRAKWNLPSNYPTVAPSYALTRSNLAKKMGLGRAAQPKRGGRKPGRRSAD
jgi:predicted transcriptional regulator